MEPLSSAAAKGGTDHLAASAGTTSVWEFRSTPRAPPPSPPPSVAVPDLVHRRMGLAATSVCVTDVIPARVHRVRR